MHYYISTTQTATLKEQKYLGLLVQGPILIREKEIVSLPMLNKLKE